MAGLLDMVFGIWSWLIANMQTLELISVIIIILTAIVQSLRYLSDRFISKPNIKVEPFWGEDYTFFGWNLSNHGHSACYGLTISVLADEIDFRQLHISQESLPPYLVMMFGYRHKKESDPPRFEFFYEPNRILQEPKLIQGTDLALKWKKDYEVVLNYHYRDSGQYVRIFKLKVGDKSKPIESFNRS